MQDCSAYSEDTLRLNDGLRTGIADRLKKFKRKKIRSVDITQAAVTIAIFAEQTEESACFLLTQRPSHLKRHKGQFALPGGRLDRDESIVTAALRELHEEVGVIASEGDVLGILDDYATRSGFNITPVVVWCGPHQEIRPDPGEVEIVYRVPLSDLLARNIPILESTKAGKHPVLSVPLKTIGDRIFAPTAAVLYQFREVVLFNRDTRVAHFDQPRFAWK